MSELKIAKSCMPKSGGHDSAAGLRLDSWNYRKHGERNRNLIRKSLEECGAGRSIVADADGEIIAGNGVFEQATEMGIPIRIIETDGTELIAIRRKDLKRSDARRKKLALADNATADSSDWDVEALIDDFTDIELNEWDVGGGISAPDVGDLDSTGGGDIDDDCPDYGAVDKTLLCCPACGHINEAKAFRPKNDNNSK